MIAILGFIISVIIFIVFIGRYMRLGKIMESLDSINRTLKINWGTEDEKRKTRQVSGTTNLIEELD